jgi:hypothetical protein
MRVPEKAAGVSEDACLAGNSTGCLWQLQDQFSFKSSQPCASGNPSASVAEKGGITPAWSLPAVIPVAAVCLVEIVLIPRGWNRPEMSRRAPSTPVAEHRGWRGCGGLGTPGVFALSSVS